MRLIVSNPSDNHPDLGYFCAVFTITECLIQYCHNDRIVSAISGKIINQLVQVLLSKEEIIGLQPLSIYFIQSSIPPTVQSTHPFTEIIYPNPSPTNGFK